MNAIVGDNGIITQAQNANVLQSCAALSEYLNQVYINDEMDDMIASNDDGTVKSSVEKMLDKYSDWFYSNGSNNYVIQEYTYVDDSGNHNIGFIKLRLIRKKNLPGEIRNQLTSGNAVGASGAEDSSDAYDQLKDVFGVTGDLQVYYCSDGIASVQGADYASAAANGDSYDGTQTLYSSSSDLSKVIAETLGGDSKDLSLQDLRTVNELKISGSSGMTDLTSLKDLPSLKKLTLTNFKGSLKGLGKAYNLNTIWFDNSDGSQNIDFTGLETLTKLSEIRFYKPTNAEVEKMCNAMKNTDYTNLNNLFLYGDWNNYWAYFGAGTWGGQGYSSSTHSDFSSLKYFDVLTQRTKESITKLMFANCSLITTDGIENFKNAVSVRLSSNLLQDITGMNNLKSLNWISLSNNPTLTSVEELKTISTIKSAMFDNLSSLTDISPLITSSALTNIYAYSSPNFNFGTEAWTSNSNALITKLSKISSLYIDSKYSLLFSDRSTIAVNSSADVASIMALSGKTTLVSLSLSGNKNLTDAQIQSLLTSLPNLKNVNLDSTNVSSLNWASEKTNLNRVSFQGTSVTDITPLVGNKSLGYLRFNATVATVVLYKHGDETFNNKIITIIETTYNKTCSEDAEGIMGHGGGFVPIASNVTTYFDQINKLENLSKLRIRYYSMPSYTIDLSNTKMKNLYLEFYDRRHIKVPSTIETISSTYRLYYDATSITNLKNLSGDGVCLIECNDVNSTFNSSQNGTNVNFGGDVLDAFSYMNGHVGPWVGSFSWSGLSGGVKYGAFNSSYLSTMTNCTTIYCSSMSTEKLNGEDFAGYTKDFKLTLTGCQVTKFENANSAIHLVDLRLPGNRISDISFFINGIENNNITILDLSSNNLSNLCSYKDENGNSLSIKTSEILAKMPKLKYVNLSGNTDLTDLTALRNSGFTETEENSKIFQKN